MGTARRLMFGEAVAVPPCSLDAVSVAVPFGAHKDTTEERDFQPVLPVYSTGIFLQN